MRTFFNISNDESICNHKTIVQTNIVNWKICQKKTYLSRGFQSINVFVCLFVCFFGQRRLRNFVTQKCSFLRNFSEVFFFNETWTKIEEESQKQWPFCGSFSYTVSKHWPNIPLNAIQLQTILDCFQNTFFTITLTKYLN